MLRKAHPLLYPAQNLASVPLLTFMRKHVWCTAWLLLAHQQKHGHQRAGISSRDKEGVGKDWSMYCAVADLGMEEWVKGGWCVCFLRPLGYQLIVLMLSCVSPHFCLLSRLHGET